MLTSVCFSLLLIHPTLSAHILALSCHCQHANHCITTHKRCIVLLSAAWLKSLLLEHPLRISAYLSFLGVQNHPEGAGVVRAENYRGRHVPPPPGSLHLVHTSILDLQLAVLTEQKVLHITNMRCNTAHNICTCTHARLQQYLHCCQCQGYCRCEM
jgi:hypothetical protein